MILKKIPKGKKYFQAVILITEFGKKGILLLKKAQTSKHYSGKYGMIAGKFKPEDKTKHLSIIRETKEEIGHNLDLNRLFWVVTLAVRHKSKKGKYFYFKGHIFNYRGGLDSGKKIKLSKEHKEVAIVDMNTLILMHLDGNLIPDVLESYLIVKNELKKRS